MTTEGKYMLTFISNRQIYDCLTKMIIPSVHDRLWIATADIKDMYVEMAGRKDMVPFLEVLDTLLEKGIAIRLIHAKEPGPNFRRDFDRFPRLWQQMERVLCPRVHFKCIISDGKTAYFGSADELSIVEPLSEQFDSVWRGACCVKCGRKKFCADGPIM